MDKSIYSREYNLFLDLLRRNRQQTGLTQEDIASILGVTQSFVSKCERGERRLDVVEVRTWCRALGIPIQKLIDDLDGACQAGQASG
ncbi:helix-turn-helix domain-containing protein [Azonexus sp. IMCC34839]|uniref:helix-turn-helix domain-containing protein n=1 Tax=Azonexus sp. IMCC34839 TaxID=3133695 RepID=UPI0039998CE9